MLAVKLHEEKKPFLGKFSYFIPILNWEIQKTQIKNWISLLQDRLTGKKKINYITLVKIPDDHPVFIGSDWMDKALFGLKFLPLKEIPDVYKDRVLGDGDFFSDQSAMVPELILGKRLPKSCIKWTKDIRLLYGKPKKTKK